MHRRKRCDVGNFFSHNASAASAPLKILTLSFEFNNFSTRFYGNLSRFQLQCKISTFLRINYVMTSDSTATRCFFIVGMRLEENMDSRYGGDVWREIGFLRYLRPAKQRVKEMRCLVFLCILGVWVWAKRERGQLFDEECPRMMYYENFILN